MHTYLQDKGRVVIPVEIRKRLNVQRGDLIYFTDTRSGVMITSDKQYNFSRRQDDKDISVYEEDLIGNQIRGNIQELADETLIELIQYES